MSIRTRMFAGAVAILLASGCSQRLIMRISSPQQATSVTLSDRGETTRDEDDAIVVLEDPARIAAVAGFFEARGENWRPLNEFPPTPRYQISFRNGNDVTDRFWLDDSALVLKTSSGKSYVCDLTSNERAKLLKNFQPPPDQRSID